MPADSGEQAMCPACGEGQVYTTSDLYQAVKQRSSTLKSKQQEVIDLSDDSESAADVQKKASSVKPLFRARSRSR